MNEPTICFFHVGNDSQQPQMLVNSIRKFNTNAKIVYCTDRQSPDVAGVSKRLEFEGSRSELMTFRLKSFASAGIDEAAIYIDTDMLCQKPISPQQILGIKEIIMCERSFYRNFSFEGNFRGLDYRNYDRMPISEVFPYLACATITKNSSAWGELVMECNSLKKDLRVWYGDQEALKIVAQRKTNEQLGFMPEHTYACLPEKLNSLPQAIFLHFKGQARKGLMVEHYERIMRS